MKKKLFLIATLAILSIGGNTLAFGKDINLHQTKSSMTKKQTAAEKKEAREKRDADKKEAADKRQQAKETKETAVASNTAKKKHKKFLGIF